MEKFLAIVLIVFSAGLISGCSTLQDLNPVQDIEAPDTPTEALGHVAATRAFVARSTEEALNNNVINLETAKKIDESLDRVKEIMTTSAVLLSKDKKDEAKSSLSTAQALLASIEKELKEAQNEQ